MSARPDAHEAAPVAGQVPGVFDFGEIVLAFTVDGKVILTPKGSPKHLTLHLGGKSRIIDVHVTEQGPNAAHKPLGGLRVGDLDALLIEAQPTLERNFERLVRRAVRRVRFGWLAHHGIYVLPFMLDESSLLALGTRRGRRWKIDQARSAELLARPLNRAEVEASAGVAFMLFKRGDSSGPYGALFKIAEPDGRFRYCWFKSSRIWDEMCRLWRKYQPLIQPRLLGPSEVTAAIGQSRVPHG